MTCLLFRLETRDALAALSILGLSLLFPLAHDPLGVRAQALETATSTAVPDSPHISSPLSAQDIQGVVEITGSTALEGFSFYTLDFGYADDPTRTWFAIASAEQSITDGVLARWDTTLITDSNYRLRLRVFSSGGETERHVVEDVRVRNYTPLDTPTPAGAVPPSATPTASLAPEPTPTAELPATAAATHFPSPTPLPANPAQVAAGQIRSDALRGAVAALLLFAIFGLLIRLCRN